MKAFFRPVRPAPPTHPSEEAGDRPTPPHQARLPSLTARRRGRLVAEYPALRCTTVPVRAVPRIGSAARSAERVAGGFFPNKNSFRKGVSYPTGIKNMGGMTIATWTNEDLTEKRMITCVFARADRREV